MNERVRSKDNTRHPNWEKWRHMPRLKLWEAVSLSLNIDPDKIKFHPDGWMFGTSHHVFNEERAFTDRMDVMRRYAKHPDCKLLGISYSFHNPDDSAISLGAFIAFAHKVNWALPEQFPTETEHATPLERASWLARDVWSEAELVELLCGIEPGSRRPSTQKTNIVAEDVRRAILAGTLRAVAPADATDGDRFFGHDRFFRPADAIAWATKDPQRFPDFPFSVEDVDLSTVGEGHSLESRERRSLLLIIAALADHANVDLAHPSKAASAIEAMIERLGDKLAARTITEHVKRAANLVPARSKR